MKRKVLAIFCACFMALSLVACGDNTSAVSDDSSTTQVAVVEKPTPEVTATVEPAEEEKPTVTVTDKPEEDKPDDVVDVVVMRENEKKAFKVTLGESK